VRSHTLRLYLATGTLLLFFVLWAVVAARPWAAAPVKAAPDPRLVALDRRRRRLAHEAALVKLEVDARWSVYARRLRVREAAVAAARRAHAGRLAEARAAAARVAAAQAAQRSSAAAVAVTASAQAPASAPASSARVVTLPPQVRIVTLPPAAVPATSSTSSRP